MTLRFSFRPIDKHRDVAGKYEFAGHTAQKGGEHTATSVSGDCDQSVGHPACLRQNVAGHVIFDHSGEALGIELGRQCANILSGFGHL